MNSHLIKKIIGKIYPALVMDDIILHRHRIIILRLLILIDLFLAIFIFLDTKDVAFFRGLFLISLSFTILFKCLDAYFHSLHTRSHYDNAWLPYEIGEVFFYCDEKDITKGFLFSDIGDRALRSLDIAECEITDFLRDKDLVSYEDIFAYQETPTSVESYVDIILSNDSQFKDFLTSKNVSREQVLNALDREIEINKEEIVEERWWSIESLDRLSKNAKTILYGNLGVNNKNNGLKQK